MIETSKHIKCIFHNGTLIEGTVESWSSEESVLKSLIDESRLIIPNTSRDIMLIKVVAPQEKKQVVLPQLDQDIEKVRKEPISDLKNKRLAELKILKSKAEKDIVANKLKEHHVGEVRKTQYGTPGFLKVESAK